MQLEVLEKEDCEKLNMGCYLAVAACSAEPPKFIHLTYKPKGRLKLSPCGCILWMVSVQPVPRVLPVSVLCSMHAFSALVMHLVCAELSARSP